MLQQDTCTQKPTSFGFDCKTEVILVEICIRCTGHRVPPGHVVLQNYPSFIPKESQHNLSRRWLCAELFRFWRGGMAPFLARFLGFWLVVVDPDFISSNNCSWKAITFCFKAFKMFLAGINTPFFQFDSQLAWHLPCGHFMELQNIMDDMAC